MLEELEVRHLGPIQSADVKPAAGMTAITGETGAGKSMLLSALSLIRGAQADAQKVSAGQESAWAQGVFDVSAQSSAAQIARGAGTDLQDGQLFLARTVPAKGRSRAILNGHTVPRSILHALSDELVTVHGQSDQIRLIAPSRQRDFLDRYAADDELLSDYQQAFHAFNDANAALQKVTAQQAQAHQRVDYLRDSISQIEKVDPQPHEEDDLREQRSRLEHVQEIRSALMKALAALDPSGLSAEDDSDASDGPSSAVDLLATAQEALEQSSTALPELGELADQIASLSSQLTDIVARLSDLASADNSQSMSLDDINERIHDLTELTRRWGPTLDDVFAWKKKAQAELDTLDASPAHLAQLKAQRDQALAQAQKRGKALHTARVAAGEKLAKEVNAELTSLAFSGARLTVRVHALSGEDGLTSSGIDHIAFLFSAFPGAPSRPIGKSASGGELSRLMLALELALARSLKNRTGTEHTLKQVKNQTSIPSTSSSSPTAAKAQTAPNPQLTFVFDEVDAGVGGEAAVELGKRLAQLARSSQVIVVTHLAQVASWADTQFIVRKATTDATGQHVVTSVEPVTGQARVAEIARMLSGTVTKLSKQHAAQLLSESTLEEKNNEGKEPRI